MSGHVERRCWSMCGRRLIPESVWQTARETEIGADRSPPAPPTGACSEWEEEPRPVPLLPLHPRIVRPVIRKCKWPVNPLNAANNHLLWRVLKKTFSLTQINIKQMFCYSKSSCAEMDEINRTSFRRVHEQTSASSQPRPPQRLGGCFHLRNPK